MEWSFPYYLQSRDRKLGAFRNSRAFATRYHIVKIHYDTLTRYHMLTVNVTYCHLTSLMSQSRYCKLSCAACGAKKALRDLVCPLESVIFVIFAYRVLLIVAHTSWPLSTCLPLHTLNCPHDYSHTIHASAYSCILCIVRTTPQRGPGTVVHLHTMRRLATLAEFVHLHTMHRPPTPPQ